jgi:hypothetical protein
MHHLQHSLRTKSYASLVLNPRLNYCTLYLLSKGEVFYEGIVFAPVASAGFQGGHVDYKYHSRTKMMKH